MLTIAFGMVSCFLVSCTPILFQHVSFWCLSFDLHPALQHAIIGVPLEPNTDLGTYALGYETHRN